MYFPHPLTAREDGLIAIGGDLDVDRLLLAYRHGIFPWYNQNPICWYFTWPRAIITTDTLHVSKSMRSLIKKRPWHITTNQAFEQVITQCALINRPDQSGTWIIQEMKKAYIDLHQKGAAHSVEVWDGGELIGGLYGVVAGKIFFGESMFASKSNASKYGFLLFAQYLFKTGCHLIDCQQDTEHMESLGTILIGKQDFWDVIQSNLLEEDLQIVFTL